MAVLKDLTGRHFGFLLVLHQSDVPYVSPSGVKTVRWVCRCERCGKEVTMLRSSLIYAKSCGCVREEKRRTRPKNQKICPVCGNAFEAPPTGRETCSEECDRIYRSRQHQGKKYPWSEEAKARYRSSAAHQAQARKQVVEATKAAVALPEGQKGPQNRECKVWILKDPSGNLHRAIGLLPWARENYYLFEPDTTNIEASARRIKSGFMAIASSIYGAPSRRNRPISTYKKWSVVKIYEKTDEEQLEALTLYRENKKENSAW